MKVVIVAVVCFLASVAPVQAAPGWCKAYKVTDEVFPEQAKSAFESYQRTKQLSYLLDAAGKLCAKPDNRLAGEVLAAWVHETGLAEADAVTSLEARVSSTWASDHVALCDAMGTEFGSDQKGVMRAARKTLLGCENSDRDDPAWMSIGDGRFESVLPFLDAGADRDELVRLAWVLGEVRHMLNPSETRPVLANYAIAQFDMQALDHDAAMQQVSAEPVRGNRYARTVVAESLAWTKMQIDRVEAAVAKKTQDAIWKDLIVTAPRKAYAEWNAAASAHKDLLTHGATPDCATLRDDVIAIIKPVNHGDLPEIEGKLRDNPLAGMMLGRYVACLGDDGDREVTKAARILAGAVPEIRGPRQAAFIATRNALGALKNGKKHGPFDAWHDLSEPEKARYRDDGGSFSDMSRGVIRTTKRVKGGEVAVTFVQDKFRYTVVECKDTDKIDRITPEGKVEYRQVCHNAGTALGDNAPSPTTVPSGCTTGVANGRFVYIWESIPWLIYADKSRKKVVAAYCLPFE